ncbi:MAG: aldehyde dehydrogenase family protein, partial [Peptococcaceae bacterium]|nr:aldehyde dehydrogenase family protein [Peptococcaceae bacterium]
MKEQLQKQREFFLSGATLDLEWRMEQLKNLKKALKKNELLLIDALKKDLGKPEYEIYTAELAVVYEELNAAIKHLYRWSEIHDVDTRIDQYPGKIHVHHVPKGLVLIISPWNYPVRLALIPLISAMAAGNAVALKPAALSKHTSAIIKQVLAETFPAEYINVYEGDIEVGRELLQEKFDHIFFSGNPKTGKEVMRAAAEHMTPVTLELGGKSPCIIEETADLTAAARRIIWGKCLNSGQTCVAPDYILIDRRLKDEMLIELKNAYQKLYPEGLMGSEDYGRMVDEAHFDKVISYLEQGDVVLGGQYDREKLKIEFTVLDNVDVDSPVMQDEIFGPVLPIATYDTIEEAMAFVR